MRTFREREENCYRNMPSEAHGTPPFKGQVDENERAKEKTSVVQCGEGQENSVWRKES